MGRRWDLDVPPKPIESGTTDIDSKVVVSIPLWAGDGTSMSPLSPLSREPRTQCWGSSQDCQKKPLNRIEDCIYIDCVCADLQNPRRMGSPKPTAYGFSKTHDIWVLQNPRRMGSPKPTAYGFSKTHGVWVLQYPRHMGSSIPTTYPRCMGSPIPTIYPLRMGSSISTAYGFYKTGGVWVDFTRRIR